MNIRPVFGSMLPIWAVTASVITAVLIWSVNCAIGGVTGRGLGGSEACITKILALDSARLEGLVGRDGVVSGICGTSRGAVAVWKSLSKISSPNSGGAGLIACQPPLPGPWCSQTISTQQIRAELNSTGTHGFSVPSVTIVDLAKYPRSPSMVSHLAVLTKVAGTFAALSRSTWYGTKPSRSQTTRDDSWFATVKRDLGLNVTVTEPSA